MEQKKRYELVNIAILLLTVLLFAHTYWKKGINWESSTGWVIFIMVITAFLVHGIKAFRLYFVLYGKNVSVIEHVKQYCKVIPVSMIFPFKLGELFRMYCYGYQIKNYFDGIAAVIVDRFADTLALVTMIFFISILNRSNFTMIFFLLVAFLTATMICYLIFPGMYQYWKHYLLKAKVSKQNNQMLGMLDKLNHAYLEISMLVKGRSTILYLLSFLAWGVEIGGLIICSKILYDTETTRLVSEYLTSALLGTESDYLRQFIIISILLLLLAYFIVRSIWFWKGKEENKC